MAMADERCGICGESKSAHVATDKGPLTHPREARGEGEYVLVRPAHIEGAFFPGDDDIDVPPLWKFVEAKPPARRAGHIRRKRRGEPDRRGRGTKTEDMKTKKESA